MCSRLRRGTSPGTRRETRCGSCSTWSPDNHGSSSSRTLLWLQQHQRACRPARVEGEKRRKRGIEWYECWVSRGLHERERERQERLAACVILTASAVASTVVEAEAAIVDDGRQFNRRPCSGLRSSSDKDTGCFASPLPRYSCRRRT